MMLLDAIPTSVDPIQNAWKPTVASLNVFACPDSNLIPFPDEVAILTSSNFAFPDPAGSTLIA